MPILDLQRRLAEVGRIRLGEQVTTRSGKKAPAKLTRFRFTSPSAELIDQAANLYGGTPNDWSAPSGPQREVVTEATSIPVLIPPGDMAFSQWYEMWSGGGCQKRCDGHFDIQRDRACDCDPDARECKPTTRVSMVLPEMAGVGLWRVETHGFYAATELGATVELLQSLAPGRLVPGRLRLDARTVKRTVDGKPQTRNYVVPVLDIEGTMAQIGRGEVPVAIEAAPTENPLGLHPEVWAELKTPGLTPVPPAAIPETTGLSVAEQLTVTKETPRRKNAAGVLPPTGLEPGQLSGGGEPLSPPAAAPGVPAPDRQAPAATTTVEPVTLPGVEVGTAPTDGTAAVGGENVTGGGQVPPTATPSGDTPATLKETDNKRYQSLNRFCRAVASGWDEDVRAPRWEALAYQVSGGRSTHLGELTPEEAQQFRARIEDGAKGRAHWIESDDPKHLGWTLEVGS